MKKIRSVSDLKMSEEDEIALGHAVSEQIRKRYGVQQDIEATRYITLAGRVLAEKSSRSHLPYQFIVLDSDAVNAFAAPGGYIHITRGALASLKSEAELAGVLGHEISHITEKHTLDAIRKMKSIELADEQTSLGQNSEVFQQVANKATEAVLQGFGRSEELEADRVGVHLASKPGYAPQGLLGFLETLRLQNQGAETRAGLFASHPETKERIKKLEKEIRKKHLQADNQATLRDRYKLHIRYQFKEVSEEDLLLEGSRGLSGSKKGKEDNQRRSGKAWWPKSQSHLESFLSYAGAGAPPGSFARSHKFGFDFETLAKVLRRAGFSEVRQSEYMQSEDSVLRLDEVSDVASAKYGDKYYSLFVEASP